MEYLKFEINSNSVQEWLISVVIFWFVFALLGAVRYVLIKRLSKTTDKETVSYQNLFLNMVSNTKWIFIFSVALFLSVLFLELVARTRDIIDSVVVTVVLIQVGLWVSVVMQIMIDRYRKQQLEKNPASATTLNVLNFIGRFLLWVVVLLLVLDNLGVNITALVAGLGVGGIAIALAVQTVLGDLFASLSIVLDKPFVLGDFLIVGDFLGTVEFVGLKTTRLRSLSGEQLVFSNSDLLNSRIRNYGRMYERRVSFNLGVVYHTSVEKMKMIPEIIRSAIEAQKNTRFDRSHFKEYGDFSLIYESVYYVLGPDYNTYMDIQQAINICIYESFEREFIEFAYPTQSLLVKNM